MTSKTSKSPSLAKILAMAYDRQKSGILEGRVKNGMVRIHMLEGKVVDVELQDGSNWKLGDFLLESGTVAENEMEKMVRKSEKKELPLEQVLIDQ